MSGAPRSRALVIDARAGPGTVGGRGIGAEGAHRSFLGDVGADASTIADGAHVRLVETGRYELMIEHGGVVTTTRERVQRARGIDVAIVVAGRHTGAASRDLKILAACGCKHAVVLVPPGGPVDLVENLGRHLLLGAGYAADEMPVLPLERADHLGERDRARLLELVDALIVPRPPGFFVAVSTQTRAGRFDIVEGTLERGSDGSAQRAFLLESERFFHTRAAPVQRLRCGAGESVDVNYAPAAVAGGAARDCVLASEPLPLVTKFRAPTVPVDVGAQFPEMCFAFGGRGGFRDGRIVDGVITLDAPIVPVDGRVGLVRFRGAGLGPVQTVTVAASDDPAAASAPPSPSDDDTDPEAILPR